MALPIIIARNNIKLSLKIDKYICVQHLAIHKLIEMRAAHLNVILTFVLRIYNAIN